MTFEFVPVPNPIATVDRQYVLVALTREQADEAFRNSALLVLCVDVPRAKYITSMVEASRFFDGEN